MTRTAEIRQSVHAPVVQLSELLLYLARAQPFSSTQAPQPVKNARAAKFHRAAAPSTNSAPPQGVPLGRSIPGDPRAGLAPHRVLSGLPGGN